MKHIVAGSDRRGPLRRTNMALRSVLALVLFVSATSLIPAQSKDSAYVVRDVRVFDGETVAERRTVVINDGRIAAVGDSTVVVPPGAQEIAGEGRTLLPGLMDAHIHLPLFAPADALQQILAFGVTSTVVMWAGQPAMSRLKELEATDPSDMAAILTAGTGATAPGGHPTQMDGGAAARLIPTLAGAADADAFVAARVAEGSDFLKIIYDDTNDAYGRKLPTLDEATVAALVTSAHSRGRIAVAHIGNERFARGAIAA